MRIHLSFARVIAALVLMVSVPLLAQSSAPFPRAMPEEVGVSSEKLDQISDAVAGWVVNGDVIGAELLIIKNDRTILHEVYGWADREERRPLQRGSIWSIKSMSKPFTAAAILMLEEDGKLSLDDTVLQYVPAFAGDERTTIRHLLTHTSGYGGLGDTGRFSTIGEWVADWAGQQPEAPFGQFIYSDFNYAALGYIVELVSGMPVERFIETRIIAPLGLEDTHTRFSPDAPWAHRVNSRYRLNEDGTDYEKYWTNRRGQGWRFYPAAWGIWSTAMDYAEFMAMWLDGGRYGSTRLLDESTVAEAIAPLEPTGDGWFYGYGWFGRQHMNGFGHGGFDGTLGAAFPEDDAIVILLTHSRGRAHRQALENRLGMLGLFEHPGPTAYNLVGVTEPRNEVELSPAERSRYTGWYRGMRTDEPDRGEYVFRVREENGRLLLSRGELAESTYRIYHLVPLGEHRFALGQYRGDVLEAIDPARTLVFDLQDRQATSLRVLEEGETRMTAQRTDSHLIEADVTRVLAERWRNWNRVPIDELVRATLDTEGIEAARERHRQMRASAPVSVRFDEGMFNRLGYRLLNEGRLQEAIAVFEMNVEAYPTAPNPHDSLGEAYLEAGRLDDAVRSYERASALAEEQNHPNRDAFRQRMEQAKRQASIHPKE